ncbi:uncharacterized protein UV8b_06801 [Ustilaginoidea virens]|uniref:Putative transcription factor kapC n=1 Tax=Ustilaginoidea virens TaxID=1159556 RepID=A0A8E5HW95_USTVR|nr:uncharacterized protein UV8b_06801 [Ustilaginoidea virens]QUC22560.1 hypothetical protein UV8b_06801 [Ustilaginoidea virens]
MQRPPSSGSQDQHLRAQLELLQSHDTDASTASESRDSRGALSHSPPPPPPPPPPRAANGYEALAAVSHAAARALEKSAAEAHIHPDLRATPGPSANMMSIGPAPGHSPDTSPAAPAPPNPSVAPAPSSPALEPGSLAEGRKAKRELSQSKRAAQNRAAQRAFRQRKEGYIKKLEQQVREFADMDQTFKSLQSENFALREYVIHLQSRLLDAQGEYPPPPPNINLSQSTSALPPAAAQEHASSVGAGTPLEAVAQAVAGLAAQEQLAQSQQQQRFVSPSPFKRETGEDDARSADEMDPQFQEQQDQVPAS